MSTFKELQERLALATYKKSVLDHLIDHLEKDFRPSAGQEAKQVLLTEARHRVPDEAFESTIADLLKTSQELEEEINSILQSTLSGSLDEKKLRKAQA